MPVIIFRYYLYAYTYSKINKKLPEVAVEEIIYAFFSSSTLFFNSLTPFFNSLTLYDTLIHLTLGMVIGFFLGLTGVGGGVLIIPILQLIFHMSPVMAVGTASMISALVKMNASISHIVVKNVAWREVSYVLTGAIPVTILVAHTIASLSNQAEYAADINQVVQVFIVAIMIFALFSMSYKLKKELAAITEPKSHPGKLKGIGSGAACGAIMASTGVGGGILILPTLNSILGVGIKRSVGSSIVIALVLSGISAIQYSSNGQSDIATALVLVAGSLAGVPLAVATVRKMNNSALYMVTIAIIIVSLIMTLSMLAV